MGKVSRRRTAAALAGRKRDPNAKRRQTTAEGQGRNKFGIPDAVEARRRAIAGDPRVGLDYPLDVLLARGLITVDMRDEGLRFAMLAWWRYGFPAPGIEKLYERMLAGGGFDELRGLAAEDDEAVQRARAAKGRLRRMTAALAGKRLPKAGPLVAAIDGTPFGAVRRVAQFLELPRFILNLAQGRPNGPAEWAEMARLIAGLTRLVTLREREDAAQRRRRWRDRDLHQSLSAPAHDHPRS